MKKYEQSTDEERKLRFNIANVLIACTGDSTLLSDTKKLSEVVKLSELEVNEALDYFFNAVIESALSLRKQELVPIFKDISDLELLKYLKSLRQEMPKQKVMPIHLALHALLSSDYNTVHLDKTKAENSHYEDVIVYGPLMSAMSTGNIYKIFDCKDYTYPIQVEQIVKNTHPMYVGQEIQFLFETSEVEFLNSNKLKPPTLKVVYDITGIVEGKDVIKIEWRIYYHSSKLSY